MPAEPISAATQVPQMVATFELDGASYRIIEGSVFETADLINLFPSPSEPSQLTPGKVSIAQQSSHNRAARSTIARAL